MQCVSILLLKKIAQLPVASMLNESNISVKVDDTGQSIGKRYARTDELGIPFAITIDHTTLEDHTVTLRDRDSCAQIRVPVRRSIIQIANYISDSQTR